MERYGETWVGFLQRLLNYLIQIKKISHFAMLAKTIFRGFLKFYISMVKILAEINLLNVSRVNSIL
jgi:hypothetical protein